MTIKNKKALLNEDFLSDVNQPTLTADQIAGAQETTEGDDDFADLLGGSTEKVEDTEDKQAEATTTLVDTIASLKDVINGVNVGLQKLSDKIDGMGAAPAAEAPAEPAPEAAPAPEGDAASQDAPPNIDLDLDNAAEAGQDEPAAEGDGTAPADEGNVEDKPAEGGEGGETPQPESNPGDEQKTEAYRANKMPGKLLNSNTGSIIGIVESGKLYKLDERLMTVVKAKIRERINEAKKQLKAELLGEEYKPAEPVVEPAEKQIDEKKGTSFLEQIKAAKACKSGKCDSEEKKDDDKKSCDEAEKPAEENKVEENKEA